MINGLTQWATLLSPIISVIAIIVALRVARCSSKEAQEQIKAIRHLFDVFVAANNLDIVDAQRKYQQQLINLEPKIEEAKFAVETAHSSFIGGPLIEQIHDHEKYLNRKEYLNQLLVKRKEIEVNLSLIQDYIHKATNK